MTRFRAQGKVQMWHGMAAHEAASQALGSLVTSPHSTTNEWIYPMKIILRMALVWVCIAPSLGLAEVKKLACTFPTFHTSNEVDMSKSGGFALSFAFDTTTNDAFLEGNNGLAPVTLLRGNSGLTFVELLQTGALQSTTVALNGSAVHSRHTIIGSQLTPSQYYGSCD
ncbi:MAG: hypothetical protein OTI35_11745 [Sulfitobacter sp.]|nr:hypothetical protein [Sulfitobacter sp.]